MSLIKLSVVVPFYNEEENLDQLHKELISVLKKIKSKSEIIYVNDGSTDNSAKRLKDSIKSTASENVSAKLVELKKNFGQTAAVMAGIDNSSGEYVSFLDADLQNDPNDISRFITKLDEGYEAVFGWRKDRKDATLRSFLSRSANRVINWVFKYPYHDVGCSARIVKRDILKEIQLYGELHRVMPVLIYLQGAEIGEIVVKHRKRLKPLHKSLVYSFAIVIFFNYLNFLNLAFTKQSRYLRPNILQYQQISNWLRGHDNINQKTVVTNRFGPTQLAVPVYLDLSFANYWENYEPTLTTHQSLTFTGFDFVSEPSKSGVIYLGFPGEFVGPAKSHDAEALPDIYKLIDILKSSDESVYLFGKDIWVIQPK